MFKSPIASQPTPKLTSTRHQPKSHADDTITIDDFVIDALQPQSFLRPSLKELDRHFDQQTQLYCAMKSLQST